MLRCMPWWEAYYDERVTLGDRKTPDLDGFHYLLRGIELWKVRGGVCGCVCSVGAYSGLPYDTPGLRTGSKSHVR